MPKQPLIFISVKFVLLSVMMSLILSACSRKVPQDGPPKGNINVSQIKNPIPRKETKSRYGNPPSYVIAGKRYFVLPTSDGYQKRGIASWYGTKFHGRLTSSREPYDMLAMTAASPELPIPCYAQVTNLENGETIIVRVNDRGPFAPNRIIDLSYAAASKLGFSQKGTALVEVKTVTSVPQSTLATQSNQPSYLINSTTQLAHNPQLFLQVGAFHNQSNASLLKQQLASLTHKGVRIETQQHASGKLFLVQIGPLKGVGESDQLLAQLQQAGYREALTVIS